MDGLTKDDVIRAYRRYAPVYDRVFGRVLLPGRIELAKVVASRSVGNLLEVGVGTGLLLPHYQGVGRIHGIDLSPEMLAVARMHVEEAGIAPVDLGIMDAEAMSFADASFDCVTLPYVLSVTPDPAKLLSEVARVCVPGGTIIVLNHFSGAGLWSGVEQVVSGLASALGFRSRLAFDILERPAWTVESVKTVNLFGLSRLVVIKNSPGG